MNRMFIAWVLVCLLTQARAQSLTEAEVCAKMYQAFELSNGGKYAEALEEFLIVGKNTELQRTEPERQVYVCSQTMVCMCYESLKRYEEAYIQAKKLLNGNTNEKEKKDICHLYAMNGYWYALTFLKKNVNGLVDYKKGRDILEEVKPYASGQLLDNILRRIPLSFYKEGSLYQISQRYMEAFALYKKALEGFHEQGLDSDELSVLKQMAYVKSITGDIESSENLYHRGLTLAQKTGDASAQMGILNELCNLATAVGNLEQAKAYAASMDSITEVSTDKKVRFTYYNKKGNEARSKAEYNIAEQWFLKGMAIAESEDIDAISANRYLSYSNLRNLYATIGRHDDALIYARKVLAENQRLTPASDYSYNLPYRSIADIYKKKR